MPKEIEIPEEEFHDHWIDVLLKSYPPAEDWEDDTDALTTNVLMRRLKNETGEPIPQWYLIQKLKELNYKSERVGDEVIYLIKSDHQ